MPDIGPLVGAIDQGTSSTRFIVFNSSDGSIITYHQIEVKRVYPCEGWVEQNPEELYDSVIETIDVVYEKLKALDLDPDSQLKCIGLTNQRESAIVWDRLTGKPLYNCIVWLDNRTSDIVDSILDHVPGRDLNWLKKKTGLPISTYFTAFKLKWLISCKPEVRQAIQEGRLMFGTVDSWILWKLTGVHATDVTNASRTLLMDIETLEWDLDLCKFFDIPQTILPKIYPSSHIFGTINVGSLAGIPITGVIGDQNAALVGQQCFGIGQAKVTYGTGCFLIQNIGPGPIHGALKTVSTEAKNKLIVTVAYKFGDNPACYAMEGSVAIAGAAITWLRDNLELVQNYSEIENIAREDTGSGGLFFVPALQGLYAPYWDANATGTIIGVSQFSRRCHFVRATLEGVAFQANDILSMMQPSQSGIKVDGGMSSNDLLCQFLADISGSKIVRPKLTEATALGAAMIAGYTLKLWPELESQINNHMTQSSDTFEEVDQFDQEESQYNLGIFSQITRKLSFSSRQTISTVKRRTSSLVGPMFEQNYEIFEPTWKESDRLNHIETWKMAVGRSRKWIRVEKQEQRKVNYKRLSTLPLILYVLISFGTHILSVNK